jgi:hypothetical protein
MLERPFSVTNQPTSLRLTHESASDCSDFSIQAAIIRDKGLNVWRAGGLRQ